MWVLIDADMILEAMLGRTAFVEAADALMKAMIWQHFRSHITDLGLDKIKSVLNKLADPAIVEDIVVPDLHARMHTCFIDRNIIEQARSSYIRDFESAVEVAYASTRNIGAIITQRPEDFDGASLSILSAGELLERQRLETLIAKRSTQVPPVLLVADFLEIQRLEKMLHQTNSSLADLSGGSFSYCDLSDTNLNDADLRLATLINANLSFAHLINAKLSNAFLSSADLSGAKLNGADLSGAKLNGADLSCADLSGADLSGANLIGAELKMTNLVSANLSNAYFIRASLIHTNLNCANLKGTDLSGADLRGADLRLAYLDEVEVVNTRFGNNFGISRETKLKLKKRGAIFEDYPREYSTLPLV